jgi:hypothetical protein
MIPIQTIWDRWQNGDATDKEAIESLAGQLAIVEDSLVPLEETKKVIRDYLSVVVERQPESKYSLLGFGKLSIRDAVITNSYDAKALDKLIAKLVLTDPAIAQQIAACRKEGSRAGGLYIIKEKAK